MPIGSLQIRYGVRSQTCSRGPRCERSRAQIEQFLTRASLVRDRSVARRLEIATANALNSPTFARRWTRNVGRVSFRWIPVPFVSTGCCQ